MLMHEYTLPTYAASPASPVSITPPSAMERRAYTRTRARAVVNTRVVVPELLDTCRFNVVEAR